MKFAKISLLLLASLSLHYAANAAKTKTVSITIDGPRTGWYEIDEKHDVGPLGELHTLNCKDPGQSMCQWTTPPKAITVPGMDQPYPIDVNAIQAQAIASISNGDLQGRYDLPGAGGYYVEWAPIGGGVYEINIAIDIE